MTQRPRHIAIDKSLFDNSVRSNNRLFRAFYHVRASHMGKLLAYCRKPNVVKRIHRSLVNDG